MIVAESDSMPDLPQVLLGDMNSAPDNPRHGHIPSGRLDRYL